MHRHRAWDNAIAYDGHIQGWAHALRKRGHHVASIGKLHYRGHPDDDYGFIESLWAMHITGGIGDVTHLVRDPDDIRTTGKNLIASAGPRESSYTLYDRQVAAAAQIWLRETGTRRHARPWVLFVSMVAPHFPLTAPPEHYYRYIGQDLPRPKLYAEAERPDHAYVRMYARRSDYDTHINSQADLQRALAGYFGLVSFLDEQIGKILTVLSETGLADTVRVIYTSDHGDNLGTRGLWGKATMYEESAGIPMLVAGKGVPAGAVCATPVTLCDVPRLSSMPSVRRTPSPNWACPMCRCWTSPASRRKTGPCCRNFTPTAPTRSTCCGRCAISMSTTLAGRLSSSTLKPIPRS